MRIKPSHALACIAGLGVGLVACTGSVGNLGGGATGNGGGFTTPLSTFSAVRKVKSALTGGDVALADTKVSAAKTLGAALGIDQALLKSDFIDNGSVKPIASTIVGAIA
jgi:hypothetical protein